MFWYPLTHWDRVTHICVGNLTSTGSDNGLSPGRRQAIIWTNAGILLIRFLGTNFSEILMGIQTFSFKKMHSKINVVWKIAAILSRPQSVNTTACYKISWSFEVASVAYRVADRSGIWKHQGIIRRHENTYTGTFKLRSSHTLTSGIYSHTAKPSNHSRFLR